MEVGGGTGDEEWQGQDLNSLISKVHRHTCYLPEFETGGAHWPPTFPPQPLKPNFVVKRFLEEPWLPRQAVEVGFVCSCGQVELF